MQSRSTAFDTLYNSGNYTVNPSLDISQSSGVATIVGRNKLISMTITGSLFAEETLSFGGCVARELTVRFYKGTTNIPRMGKLTTKLALLPSAGRGQELTKGIFFVDTRNYSSESDIMEIVGYDSMLKTEQPMIPEGEVPTDYPKSMSAVVNEIAEAIEVEVDSRTNLENWQVQLPASMTMREVLSYIAAVHCGNWVITPENKLRLIRVSDTLDTVPVGQSMTAFTVGDAFQRITHVIINIDESTYIEAVATQDNGRTIEVTCPWGTQAMANAMLAELASYVYQPYTANGALKHPAAEIGDKVTVNGYTSQIVSETFYFDSLMKSDIAALGEAEVDHEYPYQSQTKNLAKKLTTATAELRLTMNGLTGRVENLEGDLTEVEVTAGKINWLIASGTSFSNFTMTARATELITGTLRLEASGGDFPGDLSIDTVQGAAYGFALDSTDGYWKSQNTGHANSVAVCRINFNALENTSLILDCINYAEKNYDYGMIGNVDVALDPSSTAEPSTNLFHTFYSENSPDVVRITIPVTSGRHFVDVKFRKDTSSNEHNDAIWFKIAPSPGMEGSSVLTLKSGETALASAEIRITGVVTFEDLSGSGTTVINGDNIVSGTITGTSLISKSDPVTTGGSRVGYNCVTINKGNITFSEEIYTSLGGDLIKTYNTGHIATTLDADDDGNELFSIVSGETNSMLIQSYKDMTVSVADKLYINLNEYPVEPGMCLVGWGEDHHVEWAFPTSIDRLWSGSMTSPNDVAYIDGLSYVGFIIVAFPSSDSYETTLFVPKPRRTTTFMVSDRSSFVLFSVPSSGEFVTFVDTYTDGEIIEIWGVR